MLIDDGLLVRDRGRWSAPGDISAVRVPPTIQALLAARLDQLDDNERGVVERAAVVDKRISDADVDEITPMNPRPAGPEARTYSHARTAVRPDQLSLGEPTHRFRHLLIRDAAYESIPKGARRAA